MRILPGPTKSNHTLAWSPDGRYIAAGGTGIGVTIWDLEAGTTGQCVLKAGHGGLGLKFCRATGRLYVPFKHGGVWTFDPDTGAEHWRHKVDQTYFCLAISDDGSSVALRLPTVAFRLQPRANSLIGYSIRDDGTLVESWSRLDVSPHPYTLTYRPGTDQLFGLLGTTGKRAFEWIKDFTGEVAGSLALDSDVDQIEQWILAPDGERVAWLTKNAIYVQHLREPEPRVLQTAPVLHHLPRAQRRTLEQHYYRSRRRLAWSPDGRTLAYVAGPTVRLLDAVTLAELRTYDWGTGNIRAVAFSPDGLRAAVSADGGRGWVTVFDVD